MPEAKPQVELTKDQVDAIQAWQQAAAALDTAKQAELMNRLKIVNEAGLPFTTKEEGGQTLKLYAGWRLALKRTINYTVENDQAKINAALTELFAIEPVAAQSMIRWKPELNESVYKKLGAEGKKIMAQVVTMKPGTPQLELNAPAEPKA